MKVRAAAELGRGLNCQEEVVVGKKSGKRSAQDEARYSLRRGGSENRPAGTRREGGVTNPGVWKRQRRPQGGLVVLSAPSSTANSTW